MRDAHDQTFFFYDLETSGLNPRDDRIMQFAGQRTDMQLQPIGESYNLLVRLSDDTLPSPHALMVTGISPQQTVDEGYSEAEFCTIFTRDVATPGTIMVGYNNIRFDDEFIRAILWRNYYDPYEWSYADGRSRWDMLDVVRMTRALRPDGMTWPVVDGKPTNRLELLTKANNLEHTSAHDALSDVNALIAVSQRIASVQPRLFGYLLTIRGKDELKKLVSLQAPQPVVYSSGRYDGAYEKTTVVLPIAEAEYGNLYVYDLRHDPVQWVEKTDDELKRILATPYNERDASYQPVPVKKLQYNRCPAVAPLGVLDDATVWDRIGLGKETIEAHRAALQKHPKFAKRIAAILNTKPEYTPLPDPENKLYDGFISSQDALRAEAVRNADSITLANITPKFQDTRLQGMFSHYKANNFPKLLTDDERQEYELYRQQRLQRQATTFGRELSYYVKSSDLTSQQQFVCEELRLWYESVMPSGEEMGVDASL